MIEEGNFEAKLGVNSTSTEVAAVLESRPLSAPPDSPFALPGDVARPDQPTSPASPPRAEREPTGFSFGPPAPRPCSVSRCPAGHEWVPTIRLVQCPGCAAPMLVLMMQNCPACNEPTAATDLRLDHMPAGAQLMPICRGSATMAEPLRIELRHSHAAEEQQRYVERQVISKV